MRTEIFDLPSGARLEFRALTIREENMLASSRGKSMEKVLSEVIGACTVSVVEPGPYSHLTPGGKVDWSRMLQGDRFTAMFMLRVLSYAEGDKYTFKIQCPHCKKRYDVTVNLREELPIQDLSPEAAEKFKKDEPFEVVVAGRTVKFKLPLVSDAMKVDKMQEQYPDRDMASTMRIRIIEVEGLNQSEIMDWLDGGDKGEPLSSEDAEVLRAAFTEVDCGIDTDIEIECRCGSTYDATLPFDATFFLPGHAKQKAKKRAGRRLGLGS